MSTKEVTIKRKIKDLNVIMSLLIGKIHLSGDKFINDKLTYAAKKIHKSYLSAIQPLLEKKQESSRDYSVKLCMVDEKGAMIITGEGENSRYVFTPENQGKVHKFEGEQQRKFLDTEVEITPYFIDDIPEAVDRAVKLYDDFDLEELVGVLFKKVPVAPIA